MRAAPGSRLLCVAAACLLGAGTPDPAPGSLAAQNEALFEELERVHGLSGEQLQQVKAIFRRSGVAGQGNPRVTRHPVTPTECRERRASEELLNGNPRFEQICRARFMAPLYDPRSETPEQARACIDQFEFPDIPCSYPVVWVRASEAAELCAAVGRRLCDAHEWEGACAGRLEPADYPFELASGVTPEAAIRRMRAEHNRARSAEKSWSYGAESRKGVCAAASSKSEQCEGGSWQHCGSNTYPAGSFLECRSALEVYDLHGNAAEHMNLPLASEQMSSRGSEELGYTEMKGSWFIFDHYRAHEDWCRWRAPFWHGGRVRDPRSHHNYHLGFRCCRTLEPQAEAELGLGASGP